MTPSERKGFAETIKPKIKGQSDKFSWRIYQRALKRGRERVYVSTWDSLWGKPFIPDLDALKRGCRKQQGKLMIGHAVEDGGWFHGARLQAVTRKGIQRADESFAYAAAFNTSEWLDITGWFWWAYLKYGRCIIHGDQVHRWIQINRNSRKCEYCGRHERRSVETVKTIKRIEVWA